MRSHDEVLHPRPEVELDAELVVVPDDYRRSDLDRPGRGAPPPGQEVDQSRLPRSVRPHDAQSFPPVHREVDAGEDEWSVAVAEGNLFALDHLVAEAGGVIGRSSSAERTAATGAPSIRRFAASIRAWGLRDPRLGAAAEPGQLSPGQVPPGRFRRGSVVLAFGFRFEIRPVPTFVHVGTPAVELQHPGGDPIEQVTVVGHQDQTAAEGEQPLLQPCHGAQIEMVGRFVEHQELGGMRQHPGQCHPFGLAARERADVLVDGGAHTEPVQCSLGLPSFADGAAHCARRQFGRLREKADP